MGTLRHEERLRGVHPLLVAVAQAWRALPYDILITEGVRTQARQHELYQQGRETAGRIVTNAPTVALSAHGRRFINGAALGCALDAVPCTGPMGAVNYNDAGAYLAMATIAESHGLAWGGRWRKAVDGMDPDEPHFQLREWRTYPPAADTVPDFSDVTGGSSTQ